MEEITLKSLGFQINLVTPFHFLELLISLDNVSLIPSNDPSVNPLISKNFRTFESMIKGLNILFTCEYELNKFTSLSVAISILVIARRFCGAKETLPQNVSNLIGIDLDSIEPILHVILKTLKNLFD